MMNVIVCGAGRVGSDIAEQLSKEGNQVTVIDKRPDLINELNDKLDVKAIEGYASHPHILAKAGLEEADMIISVTASDEVNMIACQVAHSLFNVPTKIARVRHRDYLKAEWKAMYSRDHMPIDVIISPEIEVADAILRRLHVPGASDTLSFSDNALRVIAIRCEANCPMNNLPLSVIKNRLKEHKQTILGIIKNNKFIIPKQNTILEPDNTIYILCEPQNMTTILELFGHEEKKARKLIILGGGNVGAYLAKALEKENYDTKIKVIEIDKERAEKISQEMQSSTIINGSGLDKDILMECGIDTAETIVCVTNDDKVNILASLLAKRHGCQHSVALVNNHSYIQLLGNLGVDVIINPRESTVSSILQHVRRGKIKAIYSLHDGEAEIIEAQAIAASPIIGKTISSMNLPKDILIGAIIHNGEAIIAEEDSIILENDYVIIVSKSESIKKVENLFLGSLEFF